MLPDRSTGRDTHTHRVTALFHFTWKPDPAGMAAVLLEIVTFGVDAFALEEGRAGGLGDSLKAEFTSEFGSHSPAFATPLFLADRRDSTAALDASANTDNRIGFDSPDSTRAIREYACRVCDLASWLGEYPTTNGAIENPYLPVERAIEAPRQQLQRWSPTH